MLTSKEAAGSPPITAQSVPGLPPTLPMTIDFTTSLYFHAEGPGLLLGMSDPDERRASPPTPTIAGSRACTRRWNAAPRPCWTAPHRRLGGPVREHPRPQRPDRRGALGLPVPVRHRVLRPRLLTDTGGRRGDPRPVPGPRAVPGRPPARRRPVRGRRPPPGGQPGLTRHPVGIARSKVARSKVARSGVARPGVAQSRIVSWTSRRSSGKIFRVLGRTWVWNCTVRSWAGSTQNAVVAAPVQP